MVDISNRKRIKNLILLTDNNSGSVMVTVLVAFFFVSVLVAIIMSSVVVNFRMRSIDRSVKDEFYYAEKALNDIYTGIGIECSELMGKNYNKVLENEGGESYTVYNIENDKIAMERFNYLFIKDVKEKFDSADIKAMLAGYIVGTRAKVEGSPKIEYQIEKADKTLDIKEPSELNTDDYKNIKYTVIKNVTIVTNTNLSENPDNKGYVSSITTDIVIETPRLDFITVNKKWFDYAVIANDGIEFKGKTAINGNCYGGALTTDKIKSAAETALSSGDAKAYSSKNYGGIYIDNCEVTLEGDYVVSGGDINIEGENANLLLGYSNASQSEAWFESLVIRKKGNAEIKKGTLVYALNDLEIASDSDGSTVTVNGTYYGYNPGGNDTQGFATKEASFKSQIKSSDISVNPDAKSSKSSAIIVNAKNAKVDMTNVETLVLLGRAYIDHSSKSPAVNVADGDMSKFSTLESASLKANQELYLVPTEFLNCSNPVRMESAGDPFVVDTVKLEEWFKQFKNSKGESASLNSPMYNTVALSDGSVKYAYCYLSFEDDDSRLAYIQSILSGVDTAGLEPTAQTLARRINEVASAQNSQIIVGDDNTHIYANNAIIEYKDGKVSIKNNKVGIDRFKEYSTNMYHKYRWLDTYLDPQQTRSITNINKPSENGSQEVITHNRALDDVSSADYDNKDLPLSRLIWLGKKESNADSVNKLSGVGFPGVRNLSSSVVEADDELPGKVIIIPEDSGPYNLSESGDIFLIADCDVTVANGVKVNGFIYSSKKIIFEGNNQVTFDTSLFEQRLEKEIKTVKEELRDPVKKNNAYKNYYLISYLLDIDPEVSGISSRTDEPNVVTDLKYYYGYTHGATSASEINTDYRRFVTFENWTNGQIQN